MTRQIGEVLTKAASALIDYTETPQLDVEVLLSHVTGKDRAYFMTWPERTLTRVQKAQFEDLVAGRISGKPIAYLTGVKEFWSLTLKTSPETLIPRPDTEILVETLLNLSSELPDDATILDLGTGTGAIALAIACEKRDWKVTGVDVAETCVALAKENQQQNDIQNCQFFRSSWFTDIPPQHFNVIVSNPPYIDECDPHLTEGDVRFEPRRALVAADHGLADICHIIEHSRHYLPVNGWLLLEHGYNQATNVQEIFDLHGFNKIETIADYGQQPRVTIGCFSGNLSLNL